MMQPEEDFEEEELELYEHHRIVVDKGQSPVRIDKFLTEKIANATRNRVQRAIDAGTILVNGQPSKSNYKIKPADEIRVLLEKPPRDTEVIPENIPLDILYEDEQLIVINKPAGLVVHPAPGHANGTLVNALLAHCSNLPGIGGVQRPGIVHRLDKDTTGAIVVAKTEHAHQHLQAQLKAKTARREYLGIVYGAPKTENGTVNLPIGRHPVDRKKMAVVPVEKGGREAITHWQVKERISNYTLMQFQLETGRTHQIRVHSNQIGHPIVGDPLYSSARSLKVKLSGQALHAWRLKLQHPVTQEWLETTAPLPTEFNKLLEVLRRRS